MHEKGHHHRLPANGRRLFESLFIYTPKTTTAIGRICLLFGFCSILFTSPEKALAQNSCQKPVTLASFEIQPPKKAGDMDTVLKSTLFENVNYLAPKLLAKDNARTAMEIKEGLNGSPITENSTKLVKSRVIPIKLRAEQYVFVGPFVFMGGADPTGLDFNAKYEDFSLKLEENRSKLEYNIKW